MAISKKVPKKGPSQNPVAFYQMKQQGGVDGKVTSVPQKLNGGPLREKVYGK